MYVTEAQFNNWCYHNPNNFFLGYNSYGEEGGTAMPSKSTLKKARHNDYEKLRIKKIRISESLMDSMFSYDKNSSYDFLTEEVLNHFGVFGSNGLWNINEKTSRNIKKKLKSNIKSLPSSLEQEILDEGLLFVEFMCDKHVPEIIITTIENYIKNTNPQMVKQRAENDLKRAKKLFFSETF